MATYCTLLDLGQCGEQAVTVRYAYSKGFSGSQFEPRESPSVELNAVLWDGKDVLDYISGEDRSMISGEILEEINEAPQLAAERRGEEIREMRRAA